MRARSGAEANCGRGRVGKRGRMRVREREGKATLFFLFSFFSSSSSLSSSLLLSSSSSFPVALSSRLAVCLHRAPQPCSRPRLHIPPGSWQRPCPPSLAVLRFRPLVVSAPPARRCLPSPGAIWAEAAARAVPLLPPCCSSPWMARLARARRSRAPPPSPLRPLPRPTGPAGQRPQCTVRRAITRRGGRGGRGRRRRKAATRRGREGCSFSFSPMLSWRRCALLPLHFLFAPPPPPPRLALRVRRCAGPVRPRRQRTRPAISQPPPDRGKKEPAPPAEAQEMIHPFPVLRRVAVVLLLSTLLSCARHARRCASRRGQGAIACRRRKRLLSSARASAALHFVSCSIAVSLSHALCSRSHRSLPGCHAMAAHPHSAPPFATALQNYAPSRRQGGLTVTDTWPTRIFPCASALSDAARLALADPATWETSWAYVGRTLVLFPAPPLSFQHPLPRSRLVSPLSTRFAALSLPPPPLVFTSPSFSPSRRCRPPSLQVLKAGGGRRAGDDVFLDFENAQPTPEEQEVYDKVKVVLDQSVNVLKGARRAGGGCGAVRVACAPPPLLMPPTPPSAELETYTGAEEQIRQAISNASDETLQEAAWTAVCPLVQKLKDFFLYSSKVGGCSCGAARPAANGRPVSRRRGQPRFTVDPTPPPLLQSPCCPSFSSPCAAARAQIPSSRWRTSRCALELAPRRTRCFSCPAPCLADVSPARVLAGAGQAVCRDSALCLEI